MIKVTEIYNDVEFRIGEGNGFFNKDNFNSASWLAQLNFIDWLTGSSSGLQVPSEYASQKNRDWLSKFLVSLPKDISDGKLIKPDDYYLFDSLIKLMKKQTEPSLKNISIDLVSTEKFEERSGTFIEELKPENKPIAKIIGNSFYFEPSSIGSVVLQYIRLPKRSKLVMTEDSVYHTEIPDENASDNFEWDEFARPLLIWFIVDEFSNNTRENALKQFNQASKPEGDKK